MEHADQTQPGSIPPSDNGPIEYVHEGMDVVDASGDKIGTVSIVKMGDPQSPTIGAGPDTHQSIAQGSPQVFDWNAEPDVPPQLAAHLLRVGFIKVDTNTGEVLAIINLAHCFPLGEGLSSLGFRFSVFGFRFSVFGFRTKRSAGPPGPARLHKAGRLIRRPVSRSFAQPRSAARSVG